MDFAFSEEQEEFRATLRRFFEERWPVGEVRRLIETEAGYDTAVWKQLGEELGLPGLAIPEENGGQGFGFLELGIALEEMGRQLAGGPFLATALAGRAIQHAGADDQKAAWLPALALGERIAALAVAEPGGAEGVDAIAAVVRGSGDRVSVTGTKTSVLAAPNADLLVVAARAPGSAGVDGVSLVAVERDAPGVSLAPFEALDLSRRLADVELRDAPGTPLGAPGEAGPALARTLDEAAIALGAESVGGAARALETAVEYAKERVQFARPVGSFQAVKHRAADVALELESARSAAYWSWWVAAQDAPEPAELAEAAHIAKATCSEAFHDAAAANVQIHGGVGFTWEFDCHLYLRRAKSAELLFGDPTWHRARLAERLGF